MTQAQRMGREPFSRLVPLGAPGVRPRGQLYWEVMGYSSRAAGLRPLLVLPLEPDGVQILASLSVRRGVRGAPTTQQMIGSSVVCRLR